MKWLILILALVALSGCASIKGTAYTYTGLSHPTLVAERLYLVNRYQRADPAFLRKLGINAVMDVADDVKDPHYPGFIYAWIPIKTAASPDTPAKVKLAAGAIKTWLAEGRTVGVGCWFAENRGPWVAAEVLAEMRGGKQQDWFDWIMLIRPEAYRLDWQEKK
jgi:hypothetical protein